jgi:flagellar assembly protein FliH
MSSSPRQVPLPGPSVKLFEYPHSGQGTANSTPTHSSQNADLSASNDIQQLIAESRAQGIQEGLLQAQQKSAAQAQELARVAEAIRSFQQQASEYFGRVEVELIHLSLAIAAKILHREAQVDRMLVAALAKVALEKLQQGTKVTIHVHPDEAEGWKNYFKVNLSGWVNIKIESDTKVAHQNCVIETELGETELGIEPQLKEVERGFFDLLAQRPGTK